MSGGVTQQRPKIGFGFETVTVAAVAIGLTAATYAPASGENAEEAFITLALGTLRYRYDGTDPSATVGHVLTDGGSIVLKGQNQMSQFKAIRTTATSGVLSVTYERE